jgi:hypothetical protein
MASADRPIDDDLERFSREQLLDEVRALRGGIRKHRDSNRQDLCWHHPALWGLLPEKTDPLPVVPTWPEFLRGCVRYRQSLDEQAAAAPRTDEPYREESRDGPPRAGLGAGAGGARTEDAILWRRLDTAGHDACRLIREAAGEGGGWQLDGVAVFIHEQTPARLAYSVTCDSRWRTRRGRVRGHLGSHRIELDISTSDGVWSLNGAAVSEVSGCVDLDLGFTPATNLLSIRRLALARNQGAEVRAAWLDVSARALRPLDQRYERRGETAYWYEAREFAYAAELEVLPAGWIRRYPELWEAEANIPR